MRGQDILYKLITGTNYEEAIHNIISVAVLCEYEMYIINDTRPEGLMSLLLFLAGDDINFSIRIGYTMKKTIRPNNKFTIKKNGIYLINTHIVKEFVKSLEQTLKEL